MDIKKIQPAAHSLNQYVVPIVLLDWELSAYLLCPFTLLGT